MTSAAPASDLFIGLMSGTSLDGVDGVLVDFSQGTRVLCNPRGYAKEGKVENALFDARLVVEVA